MDRKKLVAPLRPLLPHEHFKQVSGSNTLQSKSAQPAGSRPNLFPQQKSAVQREAISRNVSRQANTQRPPVQRWQQKSAEQIRGEKRAPLPHELRQKRTAESASVQRMQSPQLANTGSLGKAASPPKAPLVYRLEPRHRATQPKQTGTANRIPEVRPLAGTPQARPKVRNPGAGAPGHPLRPVISPSPLVFHALQLMKKRTLSKYEGNDPNKNKKAKEKPTWPLPDYPTKSVFHFLDLRSLLRMMLVNKKFRQLAASVLEKRHQDALKRFQKVNNRRQKQKHHWQNTFEEIADKQVALYRDTKKQTELSTPYGMTRISKFTHDQIMTSTRGGDYVSSKEVFDWIEFANAFEDFINQPLMAKEILYAIEYNDLPKEPLKLSSTQRRASAMIMSTMHASEEDRVRGSGKYGRGALRALASGEFKTFKDIFGIVTAAFSMSRPSQKSSQKAGERTKSMLTDKNVKLLGSEMIALEYMSDDSDDEDYSDKIVKRPEKKKKPQLGSELGKEYEELAKLELRSWRKLPDYVDKLGNEGKLNKENLELVKKFSEYLKNSKLRDRFSIAWHLDQAKLIDIMDEKNRNQLLQALLQAGISPYQ